MINFNGTPGPYRLCQANDGKCSCGLIWSIPADRIICRIYVDHDDMGSDVPPEQRFANGRLMAASFCLLEACQSLVDGFDEQLNIVDMTIRVANARLMIESATKEDSDATEGLRRIRGQEQIDAPRAS